MARFTTELPDTREAISRPVAYNITRQVGKILHLANSTEILFNGPTDKAMQTGSSLLYDGAPSKFPGHSRVEVDMNEVYTDAMALAENAFQEEAPTVFLDCGLGLRLRPMYTTAELTLTFNVRSRSRTEAEKLRDDFRLRTAQGRQMMLHSAIYHIGIPEEQMKLLELIYQQREAIAGYGDTFEAWFRAHASNRLTQISALNGNGLQWVFGERQVNIQGRFNFQTQPEAPGKGDELGEYVYPVEYLVTYNKPIGMCIDYQLMNHSQLLPAQYYGPRNAGGRQPIPYQQPHYSTRSQEIWDTMFLNKTQTRKMMDGIRYPLFDDWLPSSVPSETDTVFATMVIPNAEDLQDVIDLTDLAGVSIDGHILQYMVSQGSLLGVLGGAAIHVSLFDGQAWMGDSAITVGSDLKVRSTSPLCQRNRYHVRIALLDNLLLLNDTAKYALRTQGIACQKILMTLQAGMKYSDYVPKLEGPGLVTNALFVEAAIRINRFKGRFATGMERVMLTVGNFFITAKRLDSYAPAEPAGPEPADPTVNHDASYQPLVPDCTERRGPECCQQPD